MKTLENLKSGNIVTQRNTFIVIFVVAIIVTIALAHFGVVDLSVLKDR